VNAELREYLRAERDRLVMALLEPESAELSVTPPRVAERPCEVCGEPFTPLKRKDAHICSGKCRVRKLRRQRAAMRARAAA